jgi:pimeloyl-ACP methyl ester carboxylesterase
VYPRRVGQPEEITFRAGDLTLVGELLLPDAPPPDGRRGRYPFVVLLPSWLPRDRDGAFDDGSHPTWFGSGRDAPARPGLLRRIAAALADRGVASVRYDPRGCGTSEGAWPASELFARIDDARDALGAMRGRRDLDLARTGILGHGEGATVALSVAIADPAVSALTLVGTSARSFRDVLRRGVAARLATSSDHAHPLVAALDRWSENLIERTDRHEPTLPLRIPGGEEVLLNLPAWRQAFQTPPFALATMLHRSVACVHGALDRWSHPDESRLLVEALRRGDNEPTLRIVEGAGHDLAELSGAGIAEIAADLASRLEARSLPPVLLALQDAE